MNSVNKKNTVRLHRVFKCPPNILYKAFLDPLALCKWLPPNGFVAEMHHSEIKEGGTFRMSFKNFRTGNGHSFGGKYLELKENKLIKYTDKFEDPSMPGEMQVTVEFSEVLCGTEVNILQENIPSQIPVEFCYLGWQESLALLSKIVDPEIPD